MGMTATPACEGLAELMTQQFIEPGEDLKKPIFFDGINRNHDRSSLFTPDARSFRAIVCSGGVSAATANLSIDKFVATM